MHHAPLQSNVLLLLATYSITSTLEFHLPVQLADHDSPPCPSSFPYAATGKLPSHSYLLVSKCNPPLLEV